MLKKLFYFLIPIILFTNVYADTFDISSTTKINNNLLPDYYLVNAGQNRSFTLRVEDWALRSQQPFYANFLYLKVCSTQDFYVFSQASCTSACINSEIYVVNAGGTCAIGNGTYGKNYYIFYSVDTWGMTNNNTVPYVQDNLTIYHDYSNYIAVRFNENYITNENTYIDFASNGKIEDLQKETNSKLDGINSSINNQTNSINNQTNAINNQTNAINNQTNAVNNQTNLINDDSLPNTSNFLDDWTSLLLENNTINQILYLPVNVLTNIKSALNGNCNNYTIPFGLTGGNETLTFTCWTIQDYLGTEITGLISGFIGFYLIYYFALFLWKFYDDFTSMKDTLSIILENPDGPLQKGEIE